MSEDTDQIYQGFFIAGFSLIGISVAIWCIKNRRSKPTMKKSASTEELSSVNTDDPVALNHA